MAPEMLDKYVSMKVNPSPGPPNGANMNLIIESPKMDEYKCQFIINILLRKPNLQRHPIPERCKIVRLIPCQLLQHKFE